MPHTQEQEDGFKREFATRRKRQIAITVLLVGVFIALAVGGDSDWPATLGLPTAAWNTGLVLILLGALIFSFRNWRCPACDRYLGRQIGPRFCPKCGVTLQ